MNLTEGQKRVRVDFNPSALKRVTNFKGIMADAIDAIEELEKDVKASDITTAEAIAETGSFLRECATAKTDLQKASMMGVAALTHSVAFANLPNTKIGDE